MTKKKSFKNMTSKKKTTQAKSFKNMLKKDEQSFSLNTITELLKNDEPEKALTELFNNTKLDNQIDILVEFINKSHLRAYSLALKRFNYVIQNFKKTQDEKILKTYKKSLESEFSKDPIYSDFTYVRKSIINALISPRPKNPTNLTLTASTLVNTCSINDDFDIFRKNTKYNQIDLICMMCEKLWPDKAKGLRVLYGKK